LAPLVQQNCHLGAKMSRPTARRVLSCQQSANRLIPCDSPTSSSGASTTEPAACAICAMVAWHSGITAAMGAEAPGKSNTRVREPWGVASTATTSTQHAAVVIGRRGRGAPDACDDGMGARGRRCRSPDGRTPGPRPLSGRLSSAWSCVPASVRWVRSSASDSGRRRDTVAIRTSEGATCSSLKRFRPYLVSSPAKPVCHRTSANPFAGETESSRRPPKTCSSVENRAAMAQDVGSSVREVPAALRHRRWSQPRGQGVAKTLVRAASDPRDVPIWPNQHGRWSRYRTEHR
jgi:hypothetical protein